MSKIALITGITGQDGSYLAEHLLSKGYDVHGVMRRSSVLTTERIDKTFDPESREKVHYGDLIGGLDALIYKINPDYIFNLAAQSHVAVSFKDPVTTSQINAVGVMKLLETVRQAEQTLGKQIRLYQASSSEMFGKTPAPQDENSYFHPASPYGCAKLFAYWAVRTYRDSYGMFASNGILFNHESERRGRTFVTRKITRTAARIALGLQKEIQLGNLDAKRDWGHSKDYVRAMTMILEHDKADDWVVSSGQYHTVREFGEIVFKHFGLDFYQHLRINDDLKRPSEVPALLGRSDKIRNTLGWKPEISFEEMVKEMCDSDFQDEKSKIAVSK